MTAPRKRPRTAKAKRYKSSDRKFVGTLEELEIYERAYIRGSEDALGRLIDDEAKKDKAVECLLNIYEQSRSQLDSWQPTFKMLEKHYRALVRAARSKRP